MRASKLNLDEASTQLLKTLKFRTGLTHQYLCRLAFCLSLTELEDLRPSAYNEKGLEFNRYTMTGEYDAAFIACLKEWLVGRPDAGEYAEAAWFRAHINRGLSLLPKRVKTLADVARLIPSPDSQHGPVPA